MGRKMPSRKSGDLVIFKATFSLEGKSDEKQRKGRPR
jgi:hypothetical protein